MFLLFYRLLAQPHGWMKCKKAIFFNFTFGGQMADDAGDEAMGAGRLQLLGGEGWTSLRHGG